MTEREDAGHKGQMNLKLTGTLPLIGAVRLLALREGIDAVSTLGRIQALHDAGVLGRDEHDYLGGGFRHICRLLLRQQVSDFRAGNDVSNYVDPGSLTKREQDMLADSLKAIGALGVSAWLGGADYVLFPALFGFLGLAAYALWRRRQAGSADEKQKTS